MSGRINTYLEDFAKGSLSADTKRSLTIAIHEAGHAVVSVHLGVPFKFVTIQQERDMWGFVWVGQRWPYYPPEEVELRSQILFAGMLAHNTFMPSLGLAAIEAMGNGDIDQIAAFLGELSKDDSERLYGGNGRTHYILSVGERLTRLFTIPYIPQAILETAEELMTGRTMKLFEVKAIYQSQKARTDTHEVISAQNTDGAKAHKWPSQGILLQ